MNDTPCVKQARSPALQFRGDLTQLTAETCLGFIPNCQWASLEAQMVKRLPTMWETWVQSPGQEDLLQKERATHSSTLAWKIPQTEEPGRLQSMGLRKVRYDWAASLSLDDIMFLILAMLIMIKLVLEWFILKHLSLLVIKNWNFHLNLHNFC